MVLSDSKIIYLEQEEVVESREVEREELKEGQEGKEYFNLILSGIGGFLASSCVSVTGRYARFFTKDINTQKFDIPTRATPLFIQYCCLKVPHC